MRNSDTIPAVDCKSETDRVQNECQLRLGNIHNLEPILTENDDPCLQEDDAVCFSIRKKEILLESVDQRIPFGGGEIGFMHTL